MTYIYTRAQLKSDINAKIKGKSGILTDVNSTINQGVREVLAELDLLTTRRRTRLTPNIFSGVFEYACPSDLKGYSVIAIQSQGYDIAQPWSLVPYEQFMRRQDRYTVAISDYDGIRKVFLNTQTNDIKTTLSSLDELDSGGGTWVSVGGVSDVAADSIDYMFGNGSISFNIDASVSTIAGIENESLTQTDYSSYFDGNGCVTAWVKIASTTNITNFILKIGNDVSNYYYKTVTAQSDGTAFINGWNLLRFDLSDLSSTGSPDETTISYCSLFMTKDTAKISEVGYRFDDIVFHKGIINNIYYYSGYGWQSSTGTYKVNSTADSDVLNAGEEEYQLILAKCSELAADEVDEDKVSQKEQSKYEKLKKIYMSNNPSESMIQITTYADFVSINNG